MTTAGHRHFGWSRFPTGLLGMIVLVAFTERLIEKDPLDFTDNTSMTWRYSHEKARREGPTSKILCFGSSKVKFGVQSRVLERVTGLPAYNLAVFSGSVASSYILFERAVASGARPAAVVVDCLEGPRPAAQPGVMAKVLNECKRTWYEVLTPAHACTLSRLAGDPAFLTNYLLAKTFPSVKARDDLRAWVLQGLAAQTEAVRLDRANILKQWNENRGSQIARGFGPPEANPIDRPAPPQPLHRELYVRNEILDRYSRDFLSLARKHGARVFWVIPPMGASIQDDQNRSGWYSTNLEYAQELQREFPELVVVDAGGALYPREMFIHPKHLNHLGGEAYSEFLGRVIAQHLSGSADAPKWVSLTPDGPTYPMASAGRLEGSSDQRGKVMAR